MGFFSVEFEIVEYGQQCSDIILNILKTAGIR